jgi:hypothetical protein
MNGRRARERRRMQANEPSMIVAPRPAEVRAALDGLSPELPWSEVRDSLRPVFVRRRPMPPGMSAPLTRRVPPGLSVALGVDIGPAFLYVGAALLESWSVSEDDAFQTALTNLRATIEAERIFEMAYELVDDIPIWWYQSRGGLASGLLLLEDILVERYGDQPRVLMAPMRNLLMAAPFDADRETLEWLRDEISSMDPNGLDLPLFELRNGRLTIAAGASRAAVH